MSHYSAACLVAHPSSLEVLLLYHYDPNDNAGHGPISYSFDDVLQPPSSNAILDGFYRCLIIEARVSSISTLCFFWSLFRYLLG